MQNKVHVRMLILAMQALIIVSVTQEHMTTQTRKVAGHNEIPRLKFRACVQNDKDIQSLFRRQWADVEIMDMR
jgi:hypothetical protein